MNGQVLCAVLFLSATTLGNGCASAPALPADPVADARQRLARNPKDVRVQIELAELSFQQRDYLRARQYLALAEQNPDQIVAAGISKQHVFQLGVQIGVQSQQYSDVIYRCQQWLEQEPEDVRARVLLASLLEAVEDIFAAERQWLLIIKQQPQEAHYLFELARFYERTSRADRKQLAQKLYNRYLALAPQGPEVAQVRAALLAHSVDSFSGQE